VNVWTRLNVFIASFPLFSCAFHVVSLARNVEGNEISGSIPEDIGKLTTLQWLCVFLSPLASADVSEIDVLTMHDMW
jgi:hypothetical protein